MVPQEGIELFPPLGHAQDGAAVTLAAVGAVVVCCTRGARCGSDPAEGPRGV
jgi:hypothetical protein